MSYSDDAVRAKLSSLSETQESIVTVAQWIMFHRRHADRTASLWLERLRDSSSAAKRLNLIYLANEVVQQSRARSKQDFLVAFEPLIADATALAYKGSSQDMQGKLRRVVEVWRQRNIFNGHVQTLLEGRLDEVDQTKSSTRGGGGLGGGRLGGSLFGGNSSSSARVAPEVEKINQSQMKSNKASAALAAPLNTAKTEYAKMTDPNTPVPSAPVRAAKLRGLVKDLLAAQGAVEASIEARRELIQDLEKLVKSNQGKLADDESTASALRSQAQGMDAMVRDVEDSIMRGQDTPTPGMDASANSTNDWSQRPETEGFTPPPPDVEAFTPPPPATSNDTNGDHTEPPIPEDPPSYLSQSISQPSTTTIEPSPTLDLQAILRSAAGESPHQAPAQNNDNSSSSSSFSSDPRLKRRKLSHKTSAGAMDDDFMNAGGLGVDEDGISAMLGGGGGQ
uniref:Related to RTT103 Regulator of Ty1 Transposition n=1 Tax=Ramularia collo-cygni TaxID=112498 RepID=A0A2D3VRV4_9PEZI